jgi:hypothetical protein
MEKLLKTCVKKLLGGHTGSLILQGSNHSMRGILLHASILLQLFQPDPGLVSPYREFKPLPIAETPGSSWIPILLFFSFTLLVLLRVFDGKRLSQLINGFFRASSVGILYREEYALTSRVSVLALINFLLILPLFLWQTLHERGIMMENMGHYFILLGAMIVIYASKLLTTRFIGYATEKQGLALEYTYNILLFNKTLGIALFPVTVLLAFAHGIPHEWLIAIGLSFWGIALIYRTIRGIALGLTEPGVSIYYLFVYVCTLEILPFVVLLKVFAGTPR